MARIEDMMQKMMFQFDSTNEKMKERRNYFFGVGKKFDSHEVSINQLEIKMNRLCTIVNSWKPCMLPTKTIRNPKNDWHCMAVSARGVK